MTSSVLAAGLEAALDPLLRLDPEIRPRLAALDGAVIALEVAGLGLTVYLLPGADGIRVLDEYAGEPTVRVRGTPLALAQQGFGQRSSGGAITIEGDVTVGREFQILLARLEFDGEEFGSRILGDAAAHQLGRLWRGLRGWREQTGATLRRDGVEYLQQELRVLPPRPEVERFLSAVDTLRDDVERLNARLERLRRRLATVDPD